MSARIGVDEYACVVIFCDECRWEFTYPEAVTPTLTDALVLDLAHSVRCSGKPGRRRSSRRRIVDGPTL